MIVLPDEFAAERIAASGEAGRDWLAALPGVIERLASQWAVTLSDETPRHGANALVTFGSRGDDRVALKVCWPGHSIDAEAQALRAWGGEGSVRLFEHTDADNAVLLERLDPHRSLESLDIVEAAAVIGRLIRQLSIPAPAGFPAPISAAGAAQALREKRPLLEANLPVEWVRRATELAEWLADPDGDALLHTDLHAGNVLAGSAQRWVAIDPRPSVGHPERSAPDLLLWGLPLAAPAKHVTTILEAMVEAGGLDPGRARAWTIVGAVSHWLWCFEEDVDRPAESRCTVCDPRCRLVLEALV